MLILLDLESLLKASGSRQSRAAFAASFIVDSLFPF